MPLPSQEQLPVELEGEVAHNSTPKWPSLVRCERIFGEQEEEYSGDRRRKPRNK